MPKPLQSEVILCEHFKWHLTKRSNGVWYADGRSTRRGLGRHSLGTREREAAIVALRQLDVMKAQESGIVASEDASVKADHDALSLERGIELYKQHYTRAIVVGGVQASTQKKYRSHADKVIPYLRSVGVLTWQQVKATHLSGYAGFLKKGGRRGRPYSDKSIVNELTFVKQLISWLIQAGHMAGEPIRMKLVKPESQRPYCWRREEVAAMVAFCDADENLKWLGEVIIALACTGLRISELAGLRWSDLDLKQERLTLTDETNRGGRNGEQTRRLKSGRSRSFPVHPRLLEVLRTLRSKDAFVFHGPRGGRLKPDTVRRLLIREVLTPLTGRFPTPEGELGFADGRLHSFRHYFCSTCANENIPEKMLMVWLGHADSEMVRHYYHLHDDEARRRMNELNFLGGAADVPSAAQETHVGEEGAAPERYDAGQRLDGYWPSHCHS